MSGFATVTDRVGGVGGTLWTAGLVTDIYNSLDRRGLNVRDPVYGVTGNGTTNDAPAINALLAAAVDGDVIFFPRGTYLVASQITWSNKRLTLRFDAGAKLKESGSFTTPIVYLNNCDGSVLTGLTVEGAEAFFINTVDPTTYALQVHLSDDVTIQRCTVSSKSRGLKLSAGSNCTVENVRVAGMIRATALNGGIDAAVTTITVTSTTSFPAAGTIKIDSEKIAYTGKTATTFTGCTRASFSTTAAAHLTSAAVIEWYENVNYHTSVYFDGMKHSTVRDVRVNAVGSAILQGTIAGASEFNLFSDIQAHNIYDNAVYLSGGADCSVRSVLCQQDAGHVNGSSCVKMRGNRHRASDCDAYGTLVGFTLSGDAAVADDAHGAIGHGSSLTNCIAYKTRTMGFYVDAITATVTDGVVRDATLTSCTAIECCQDASGEDGSFKVFGAIGVKLIGCKAIDDKGSLTTGAAFFIVGSAARTGKRNELLNCEAVWPTTGAPARYSVEISNNDDTLVDGLLLANTADVGVRIISALRTRVLRTRPLNVFVSSATVFPAASTAVDTVIEMVKGLIWVDSGVGTVLRWPDSGTLDVTATYTFTMAPYDGVRTLSAGGTGAAYSVFLPILARSQGREITLKRTHATQNITLDGSGAETIDGALTKRLDTQYAWMTVRGMPTEWAVVSQGGTVT